MQNTWSLSVRKVSRSLNSSPRNTQRRVHIPGPSWTWVSWLDNPTLPSVASRQSTPSLGWSRSMLLKLRCFFSARLFPRRSPLPGQELPAGSFHSASVRVDAGGGTHHGAFQERSAVRTGPDVRTDEPGSAEALVATRPGLALAVDGPQVRMVAAPRLHRTGCAWRPSPILAPSEAQPS